MGNHSVAVGVLLASTACGMALHGAPAAAQTAGSQALSEVVVTASKRPDTISKVPISITAVTPKDIEQQGLKAIDDLSRLAPALTIRRGLDNQVTIAVRGIIASAGAQTTGVYLDDVPLQKRIALGASTGNGNPSPPLFDLERVEVLRGPQGTLYGGSSEGGTIRFITPTPSLTTYSDSLRGEVSTTEGGDPSYEAGVAVGGPIVKDKLGFRASIYDRHDGGWIDRINVYTGASTATNSNYQDTRAGRVSLLWEPIDNLKVNPAFYTSFNYVHDADQYNESFAAFTVGPIKTGTYTYPAHTYGPVTLNTSTSLLPHNDFRTQTVLLPSLSLEYALPWVTVKSVTAYIADEAKGASDSSFNEPGVILGGTGLVSELPNFWQNFTYKNKRRALTEEFRLSSDPASRFNWVGGIYYSHSITDAEYDIYEDLNSLTAILLNQTVTQRYKTPLLPNGSAGTRKQTLIEEEIAAFGEANYNLTDKLKLIAGLRATQTKFDFTGSYIGPVTGVGVIDPALGSLATGSVNEKPITPKLGVQYQLTSADMVYANVAKGFRPGGVNTPVPVVSCAAGLAAYGGTPPSTYTSDSVISYEAGTKVRLFSNRVAINASAFKIDWSNVQVSLTLPGCTFSFTANAGAAVSQGVDVQSTFRVVDGLTVVLNAGYDDAHYTQTLQGPPSATGARSQLINRGDELPVAPWTVDLAPQYDFMVGAGLPAYIRADYQFASAFHRTFSVGTTAYNPDLYAGNSTTLVNGRVGVRWNAMDMSLFANNLLDSHDLLSRAGGPTGCGADPACAAPTSFNHIHTDYSYRPRTVGFQVAYRH